MGEKSPHKNVYMKNYNTFTGSSLKISLQTQDSSSINQEGFVLVFKKCHKLILKRLYNKCLKIIQSNLKRRIKGLTLLDSMIYY